MPLYKKFPTKAENQICRFFNKDSVYESWLCQYSDQFADWAAAESGFDYCNSH